MIDFRYHLVSLVAVFIALAVGIALGAGPLREGISSTLESEVADLRSERAALRAQVDSADGLAEARDSVLRVVHERVVAGTLQDVRAGVVVLPGADRNTVDRLEGQLEEAGATVVLTAEIDAAWEDQEPDQARLDLVAALAQTVADPEPRGGGQPDVATVLAAVLAGADEPGLVGAWLDAGRQLEDGGLIDLTWRDDPLSNVSDRRAPEALLVVSGGLSDEAAGQEPGSLELEQRLGLVDALARLEIPVVVAGEGTDAMTTGDVELLDPLVGVVRDDRPLADEVSTVDNVESAAGQLVVTMAMAWEVLGEAGHYGLGRGATGPTPALPPVPAAALPGTIPAPRGADGAASTDAPTGPEVDEDPDAQTGAP
ncbi:MULTISPECIES: copper transporter [unclassified Ornithinimicrobium]|uniref:copper transporter n=1 Tax=unclassified Ornithinimicrobium TaxID=2615080 RepID=UPI003851B0BF